MKEFENDIKNMEELFKNDIKHLEELSENDIKQELSDNDKRENFTSSTPFLVRETTTNYHTMSLSLTPNLQISSSSSTIFAAAASTTTTSSTTFSGGF
ncbi:hypothetical protein Dsin_013094 [Dipteronia sinensis]|uniref:Uncharacterized protein n=1 Tax=Dipteronia sinensis TaxID=43782 RepID=A0AAE0AKI8_9ROSI|nr:hypothetical protein Dsin_013094 [Dipteronia sinensis]